MVWYRLTAEISYAFDAVSEADAFEQANEFMDDPEFAHNALDLDTVYVEKVE